MNLTSTAPTTDPLNNADALAVAKRIAAMMGPAIRAADGTVGAALYLSLGAALATTRAFSERSLYEVIANLSQDDELAHWERALGMLSGEGAPVADRQRAVHARWIALRAGPSVLAIRRALERLSADVTVIEIMAEDVADTDPLAAYRIAILLPDAQEADRQLRAQISVTLAPMAQAQLAWAIGRGDGGEDGETIDDFLCDSADSLVERDLLAS
ncbi:MAG: hypothetical protein Q8S73_26580 [Deltaproteobacteria bacterium]|nr:hypothetical protein [Myxococcales bacterium]MDP3217702.1 hypothetical protein [Deltaproteobacteria bacterium]